MARASADLVSAERVSEALALVEVYRAEPMRPERGALALLAKLSAFPVLFLAQGQAAQAAAEAADRGTEPARAPDQAKMKSMESWAR